MWKLYAKGNDGVAVVTEFQTLAKSFTCEETIQIGKVRYVDYDKTYIPERNGLGICLHKRKSFEHEREVRAFTGRRGPVASKGQLRSVDLSVLVKDVFVAPYADEWFRDLVESVTRHYGLVAEVRRSTLAASPVW